MEANELWEYCVWWRGSALPGSKFSFDPSIDDASSLLDCVSRRSFSDTSITSTADLSVFSSATRSHAQDPDPDDQDADDHDPDNSLEIRSNASDASSGPRTSTPQPPPPPPRTTSPDVVRIYVPYTSPSHPPSPAASPAPPASPSRQNGEVPPRSLPRPLSDTNKIRIRVDSTQEEQTPIVEHGHLVRPFGLNSPNHNSPEVDI